LLGRRHGRQQPLAGFTAEQGGQLLGAAKTVEELLLKLVDETDVVLRPNEPTPENRPLAGLNSLQPGRRV
jgi:hypothetical protein